MRPSFLKGFLRIAKAGSTESGSAFTLVELIVVVAVLAVLATVGFLSLSGYSDDARSAVVKANVRTVYSAILAESATSGNSPRWYVEHSSGAALSGGFVISDGKTVPMTGGDLGLPPADSNYTAGNPRWDRLRMNGEKFRLASAFGSPLEASVFRRTGTEGAEAGYSTGSVTVGAVDLWRSGISGRRSYSSVFQVAGVIPQTGVASVVGNYSAGGSGAVAWLIDDPSQNSATWALADGMAVGAAPAPSDCQAGTKTVNGHAYSVGAIANGASATFSTSASVTWGVQAYSQAFSCSNGTASPSGTETVGTLTCLTYYSLVGGSCTANAWIATAWSACSVTCGGGTQTRAVSCQTSAGAVVADANCAGTKPATSQACNTGTLQYACPSGYNWSWLSLDCYSLNSSHNANEMCCKNASGVTVTCVVGGAQVSGCSAVSAPSQVCL